VTTELLAFIHGSSLLFIKTIADSTQMATPGQANAVTVEDIDQSLLQIAAFDKRSSPAVQSLASSWKYPDGIELLGNIYRKLQAREAKWLTRLVLKSYAPIQFPENLEPGPQHSYLPNCVQLNIKFPSSAPAPVRRDGTRLIIGVGPKDPVIPAPISTRNTTQPPSLRPAPAREPAPPLSTASTPQPVSPFPRLLQPYRLPLHPVLLLSLHPQRQNHQYLLLSVPYPRRPHHYQF
jgi:hypothetical protein